MKKILLLSILFFHQVLIAQESSNEKYKPIPLPKYSPPKDSTNKSNGLIKFNITSQKLDTLNIHPAPAISIQQYPPNGQQVENEFIKSAPQNYAFSNLQAADLLSGFPNYPMSSIVKLNFSFYHPGTATTSYGSCSGAIINSQYILTAGHCVFNPTDQSYIASCDVIPAYNMGNAPFGYTTANNWYSFTQWTSNNNYDYDMAILSLATPIGNTTGWLGWGSNMMNSFFTTSSNTFHSFGYPAQDDWGNPVFENGERMYYMNGYMDFWESANSMCHYNLGFHGQSGSGLYYKDANNNRYAYGVLSHGNGQNPPYYTCHCRMSSDMFNYFSNIIGIASGNEEITAEHQIQIFPNPSVGVFNLQINGNLNENEIKVLNLVGQEVLSIHKPKSNAITTIDLSNQANGLYILYVKVNGMVLTKKIYKTEN